MKKCIFFLIVVFNFNLFINATPLDVRTYCDVEEQKMMLVVRKGASALSNQSNFKQLLEMCKSPTVDYVLADQDRETFLELLKDRDDQDSYKVIKKQYYTPPNNPFNSVLMGREFWKVLEERAQEMLGPYEPFVCIRYTPPNEGSNVSFLGYLLQGLRALGLN